MTISGAQYVLYSGHEKTKARLKCDKKVGETERERKFGACAISKCQLRPKYTHTHLFFSFFHPRAQRIYFPQREFFSSEKFSHVLADPPQFSCKITKGISVDISLTGQNSMRIELRSSLSTKEPRISFPYQLAILR